MQRRRELGLLRALGVSNGAGAPHGAARGRAHHDRGDRDGPACSGCVYGWAGAQSLLGSVPMNPDALPVGTFVWPAVPFWPVVAIVVATAVLTLVAAVVPTRLATRVAPVEALAE